MAAKDTDDSRIEDQDNEGGQTVSQASIKKMIAQAKDRGFITYEQLNQALPPDQVASEQIEDVMSMLSEMGINIIEDDEDSDEGDTKGGELVEIAGSREVALSSGTGEEKLDRTDDPVRMYLREMGSVELLSREGEIAIAKRIEAGRNTMILGLCESPLTFQAITIWRDELLNEDVLLRDVIDLEATFGNAMDGDEDGVPVAGAVYDPNADEMFSAIRGGGTRLNGLPVHVATTASIDAALLGLSFSFKSRPEAHHAVLRALMDARGLYRFLGSGALGLAYCAAGRVDGFWEDWMMPWDVAAGLILVTEAGGLVSDYAANDGWNAGNAILASSPAMAAAFGRITGLDAGTGGPR
jgi:hypothetical protein